MSEQKAWILLTARVCHEANRAIQLNAGDPNPSPKWDDAPKWQKKSAVNGVVKALNGVTPEDLHQSWCDEKVADGWKYGKVKDAEAKTHPCLVNYDQLPEEQKLKDHVFKSIVDTFRETAFI